MHFERIGTGPALVLIPGLACDGRLWAAAAKLLTPRFTAVFPEIWSCPSIPDAAQGIADILDELGGGPAGIAGLSMGGYVAFELLRTWPHKVRAAALLDSTPFPDSPERREKRLEVLERLEQGGFDPVLADFLTSVLSPDNAGRGPARNLLTAMAQDLGQDAYARSLRSILERESYEDVLPLVRVPLLFLTGEYDSLTPPELARRIAAGVPGARAHEISGAGHMTPLEAPEQVGALLNAFFGKAFFPDQPTAE